MLLNMCIIKSYKRKIYNKYLDIMRLAHFPKFNG